MFCEQLNLAYKHEDDIMMMMVMGIGLLPSCTDTFDARSAYRRCANIAVKTRSVERDMDYSYA